METIKHRKKKENKTFSHKKPRKVSTRWVFHKTTDHRPIDYLSTDSPTTYHLPTNPPTTYPPTSVKTEDQILNMFCILWFLKTLIIFLVTIIRIYFLLNKKFNRILDIDLIFWFLETMSSYGNNGIWISMNLLEWKFITIQYVQRIQSRD